MEGVCVSLPLPIFVAAPVYDPMLPIIVRTRRELLLSFTLVD